jgi:NADH-quinone oxidoreductase subunit C
MTTKLETLKPPCECAWAIVQNLTVALGELTLVVKAADYLTAMRAARRCRSRFEQLIDLCGVDYSTYGDGAWDGRALPWCRTCCRSRTTGVRVRVFAPDDDLPVVASVDRSGTRPTGSSAKRSTCTASCSKATPTCAAS